jgi:hypothetical protein
MNFFLNPDTDNSGGKGSGTYNAAPKLTIMVVHISGALVAYTKV